LFFHIGLVANSASYAPAQCYAPACIVGSHNQILRRELLSLASF